MVICNTHNFIYLRIPKNASTSLATFFIENYCTDKDRWTAINDSRKRNHNITDEQLAPYKERYAFIHMTMEEIVGQRIITKDEALSMQSYGVIRDPLERQLSLYFFLNRGADHSVEKFRNQFRDGKHNSDPRNHILQSDYYKVDGQDNVHWWLYDNIDANLADFVNNNPQTIKTELPKFKASHKPRDVNLIDKYYDQKTRDAVLKYYEKDFELIDRLRNK